MSSLSTCRPGDRRGQPVVAARDVGAGVVGRACRRLRGGAPGGEVAVAQRAQRLAQPLVRRVVALVRSGSSRPASSRLRGGQQVSARSATTRSAPCSLRSSALVGPAVRSTPTTRPKPPRRPASTPASASSTTAASPAGTPSRRAASRKIAGSGLPGSSRRARLVAVDHGLEQVPYSRARQQFRRVPGSRDRGARHTLGAQRVQQSYGAGPGGDRTRRQPSCEQLLLAGGDGPHRSGAGRVVGGAGRQSQPARGEEGGGAVQPGPAVDVAAVVLHRVERALPPHRDQAGVEGLLPGGGVQPRGVCDHSVGVEHHGPNRPQAWYQRLSGGGGHSRAATYSVRSSRRLL